MVKNVFSAKQTMINRNKIDYFNAPELLVRNADPINGQSL